MNEEFSGSCLCGAVQLVASGPPVLVAACHCASCRKHTGAPVAVFVDYARKDVAFKGEPMALFESSKGVTRGFCGQCGSTISYEGDNLPHMIHLHLGVFDDPTQFQPTANENTATQFPWLCIRG